jgi:hypothetical protein
MKTTGCKDCNRILWEKDADKDGLCEDCAKPEPKAKKGPKDSDK